MNEMMVHLGPLVGGVKLSDAPFRFSCVQLAIWQIIFDYCYRRQGLGNQLFHFLAPIRVIELAEMRPSSSEQTQVSLVHLLMAIYLLGNCH